MNKKVQEYRKSIADAFIKSLQESPSEWKQQWASAGSPFNAATGRKYHGINRFYLSNIAYKNGYSDPRWCTFKQIQDKHWHLTKGSKGATVEYWMPYDREAHRIVSWAEYNTAVEKAERFAFYPKYFTVFNAQQIEGISPLPEAEKHDIHPDEIVDKISKSMDVSILHAGDRAFYVPALDVIRMPPPEIFLSNYAYNATALHELSHATGHPERLNRYLGGTFGTADYAYEELIAEISSCFMSSELPTTQTPEHIKNHKAYIQSWIQSIKEKPEVLMSAIKEAEKAANYLEYHAGLISEKEFEQLKQSSMTISDEQVHLPSPTLQNTKQRLNVIEGVLCNENTQDDNCVKNMISISVETPQGAPADVKIPVLAYGSAAVSLLARHPGDKISFVGELIKDGKTDFGYEIKKIDDSGLLLTATDKLLSDYIKTRDTAKYEVKNTVKEKNSTIEMEK